MMTTRPRFLYLLTQLLDEAAERYPEREALRYSGQSLTYEELSRRSGNLASTLIQQGVRRGDRVGFYMEKSLEAVVAIYGIMKAGAAYVPIDPLTPLSRVAFIIQDCGLRYLISSESKSGQLQELHDRRVALDCVIGVRSRDSLPVRCIPWEEVHRTSTRAAGVTATEMDLAYILYTSGSTGDPKGVMHTHRSALSFALWAVETFGIGYEDRLSNHAPYHFDLTILDLFASAAAAASTVIIPEDVARLPATLAALISEEHLTVWYSVPFALMQLLQRGRLESLDLTALRCVLFAGEPFPPKHLHQLMQVLPQASFFNLYGPTETNVCTFYEVPAARDDEERPLPIGQACADTELLVVDAEDEPVAPDEIGELLVRSAATMSGYWNRPEQTERAFLRRSTRPPFQEVFYRTGDLVQLEADGNYQFLGRKDRQVKVRGFRIELDEIEVALLSHAAVAEAAVYLRPGVEETVSIETAVVARPGTGPTALELSRYLSERLPSYAIPNPILIVDQLPRTSTGKIDRRTLRDRALPAHSI
jgi:amino acid adenylation domain-containing protein